MQRHNLGHFLEKNIPWQLAESSLGLIIIVEHSACIWNCIKWEV